MLAQAILEKARHRRQPGGSHLQALLERRERPQQQTHQAKDGFAGEQARIAPSRSAPSGLPALDQQKSLRQLAIQRLRCAQRLRAAVLAAAGASLRRRPASPRCLLRDRSGSRSSKSCTPMNVALTGPTPKVGRQERVEPGIEGGRAFERPRQSGVWRRRERQVDPAALVKRQLDRVDHLLDPGAVLEIALVARVTRLRSRPGNP